jgi:cob(I)alamin adenosyltransferase
MTRELIERLDLVRAQRIPMHVADQADRVRVVPRGSRTKAILHQMPDALVAAVEVQGIARADALHRASERSVARLEHEVDVVRHEDPRQAAHALFGQDFVETTQVVVAVGVVDEGRAAIDAALNHVMNDTGRIEARSTRHIKTPRDQEPGQPPP